MEPSATENPKLRLVDAKPVVYEGANYLLLRDPLALSEKTILIPQPYIPLLALFDGTHNIGALRAALALRYGIYLTPHRIKEMIDALDDALLLDNTHSLQAREATQAAFRQADYRPPANAGATYPEDPQELSKYLDSFIQGLAFEGIVSQKQSAFNSNGHIRGIISPHIDYERGGPVYAQVWSQAAEAVRAADLAIIFGTDHFSEGYGFSLTRQNYATPYGTLPTATDIVDELAQVIGPQVAFAGEIHHKQEHSIELAAVWMHHMRDGQPVHMVPILTGSLANAKDSLEAVLAVLQRAIQGRPAVVIAAGDLAHVGPAFDTEPFDPGKLIQLKQSDDALIDAMCRGDAAEFFQSIESVQDKNNVCGVSPIYLTLRLLYPTSGQSLGYAVCPADENLTSFVTVCGVALQ